MSLRSGETPREHATAPARMGRSQPRLLRGRSDCTDSPQLFDPATTTPKACPVGSCGAIRFPGQTRVPTCAHDLEPDPGKRPRQCLNTYDPGHQEIPY